MHIQIHVYTRGNENSWKAIQYLFQDRLFWGRRGTKTGIGLISLVLRVLWIIQGEGNTVEVKAGNEMKKYNPIYGER